MTEANPTDCSDMEDSVAGAARCMIRMARLYAPGALVGLHSSAWMMEAPGDAEAVGTFLLGLGADEADFLVDDASDRDAGYYEAQGRDTWWTDESAQAFLDWSARVVETTCKPMIMWQVPVGNMSLDDTTNHYRDNRVDWLFSHTQEVTDAHFVGLLFGAGQDEQTTPETDGGNLIAKTQGYFDGGGDALCGE